MFTSHLHVDNTVHFFILYADFRIIRLEISDYAILQLLYVYMLTNSQIIILLLISLLHPQTCTFIIN